MNEEYDVTPTDSISTTVNPIICLIYDVSIINLPFKLNNVKTRWCVLLLVRITEFECEPLVPEVLLSPTVLYLLKTKLNIFVAKPKVVINVMG